MQGACPPFLHPSDKPGDCTSGISLALSPRTLTLADQRESGLMKNKFSWGGLLAVIGLMSLASGTASATPLTFSFTNIGSIDSVMSCGIGCSTLNTSGDLWIGGADVGSFAGTMKVIGFGISEVDDSSTWSFLDTSGLNDLFGTL